MTQNYLLYISNQRSHYRTIARFCVQIESVRWFWLHSCLRFMFNLIFNNSVFSKENTVFFLMLNFINNSASQVVSKNTTCLLVFLILKTKQLVSLTYIWLVLFSLQIFLFCFLIYGTLFNLSQIYRNLNMIQRRF